MRIIISLLLTITIYSLIIIFFIFFLFPKKRKEEKVYIHTAIIAKKAKINSNSDKNKQNIQKKVTKIKKTIKKIKKNGSKSSMTHGGDNIGFNDIFKNVDYNIKTDKIKIKKQLDMSRLKGIERDLKKIKKISFNVNFIQTNGQKLSKEEINDIISKKLSIIWDNISNLPSDYAKIQIESYSGITKADILESNLENSKQKELVAQINNLKFDKNFNIIVIFQSKVNND